jgi:hypothetical protein
MSMSEAETDKVREMISSGRVTDMIPLDRSTLRALESEGLFPKGHWVTSKKKLWFKDEVVQWQRDLADPNSELSKAVRLKLAKS